MFSVFHDLVEVSCDSVVAKSLRHIISMSNALKLSTQEISKPQVAVVAAFCTKNNGQLPSIFFLMFIFSTVPGAMRCIVLQAR